MYILVLYSKTIQHPYQLIIAKKDVQWGYYIVMILEVKIVSLSKDYTTNFIPHNEMWFVVVDTVLPS